MTAPSTVRSDEEIQRDVLDEIAWDAQLQPNEIGVIVRDGVVTLTGRVDSFAKKWEAERAAWRVRGVVAAANDIEVRLPGSSERSDADIAAAAARALEWDALISPGNVRVTVSRGWATLEGEVEWQFQRREAERAVRRLTGVRGVTNLIRVRPGSQPSPGEVKRRIEEALVRSAETDADRVQVEVQDGNVSLRGAVRSWAERDEAERVAWSGPGVTDVDNQITIRL
jgi:osmotically-inducible protein OsmY